VAAGEDDRRRVVSRFFERHPEQRGTRLERRALAATQLDRGLAYASVGEHRLAAVRLLRASRLAPLRTGALTMRLLARSLRRSVR
jgi:hypothetical protein